jgi:hypothetical protein
VAVVKLHEVGKVVCAKAAVANTAKIAVISFLISVYPSGGIFIYAPDAIKS